MTSTFKEELEKVGPKTSVEPANKAKLAKLEARVPLELMEHWRGEGYAAYADGLLWITDPEQVSELAAPFTESSVVVFGRNAFGDLFAWGDDVVQYLDVHRGEARVIVDEISVFMDLLSDEEVADSILRKKLFDAVRARLPAPRVDQCYGFVPPLAMGGATEPASVELMDLRVHLALLGQVHE